MEAPIDTGAAATPAAGVDTGQGATPGGQPGGDQNQGTQAGTSGATGDEGSQNAGNQAPSEIKVPLTVVEALRDELKGSKSEVQNLKAQVEQFQMLQNMGGFQPIQPTQQPVQQPVQTQQPAGGAEDPFSGIEDDDLINAKDLKKIVQTLRPGGDDVNKAIEPINAILARLQVQIEDPNYEQTIRTYLPEIMNSQPFLRDVIARSPNPLQTALAVARMSPKFIQAQAAASQPDNGGNGGATQQPADVLSDLQKIIDNATKVGAPGSMGGSGAVSGYDRFKTMSDADFDAEVQRVLDGVSYGQ